MTFPDARWLERWQSKTVARKACRSPLVLYIEQKDTGLILFSTGQHNGKVKRGLISVDKTVKERPTMEVLKTTGHGPLHVARNAELHLIKVDLPRLLMRLLLLAACEKLSSTTVSIILIEPVYLCRYVIYLILYKL